jgi:DNA-binding response OmpR family regulator
MREKVNHGPKSDKVGKAFVRELAQNTNAGVIVYSNLHANTEAATVLDDGADDYIEKLYDGARISAHVAAVWRRTQHSRIRDANTLALAHTNRTFQLGHWRFVIGSRVLQSTTGQMLRVSPTEHAFLKYICLVEDHIVDGDILNFAILERKEYEKFVRIDNLVYRLRGRLGEENVDLRSMGETAYKLINVKELKPSIPNLDVSCPMGVVERNHYV